MKLKTLQNKVIASIREAGLDVDPQGDMHPNEIQMIVEHAVLGLGLAINRQTGDIYNPAYEGKSLYPEDRNVRYAGMRSRAARGKR